VPIRPFKVSPRRAGLLSPTPALALSSARFTTATKPETLGVALTDSPAGLAAWFLEKFNMCVSTCKSGEAKRGQGLLCVSPRSDASALGPGGAIAKGACLRPSARTFSSPTSWSIGAPTPSHPAFASVRCNRALQRCSWLRSCLPTPPFHPPLLFFTRLPDYESLGMAAGKSLKLAKGYCAVPTGVSNFPRVRTGGVSPAPHGQPTSARLCHADRRFFAPRGPWPSLRSTWWIGACIHEADTLLRWNSPR
jgi:hypothetical protein